MTAKEDAFEIYNSLHEVWDGTRPYSDVDEIPWWDLHRLNWEIKFLYVCIELKLGEEHPWDLDNFIKENKGMGNISLPYEEYAYLEDIL